MQSGVDFEQMYNCHILTKFSCFFLIKIQMEYTTTFLIKSNCIIALKVKAMLRWRLANLCILKRGGVSTSKDLLLMWPPYLFSYTIQFTAPI